MPPFKDPSFQDRTASAAQARQRALDKLKARPPIDPAVLEERKAAQALRDAAAASAKPVLTEAEKKAARDARYAARKSRAGR